MGMGVRTCCGRLQGQSCGLLSLLPLPPPPISPQPLLRCLEFRVPFVPCLPGAAQASHADPLPPQPQLAECEQG